MLYYDLVDFDLNDKDLGLLGFKHIFSSKSDVDIVNSSTKSDKSGKIIMSDDMNRVMSSLRSGGKGVVFTDYILDKKTIQFILNDDSFAIIPLLKIEADNQFSRERDILFARSFTRYLLSKRVKFSFVTMAPSKEYLLSRMQLIKLASMVTEDEETAKEHISNLKELINYEG